MGDLGAVGIASGTQSHAAAANDTGIVVGSADYKAVVWTSGTPTLIDGRSANGINNEGVVVGQGSDWRAAMWVGATRTSLGTLGGSSSIAVAINNIGQAVGSSRPIGDPVVQAGPAWLAPSEVARATLWDNGAIVDLGTLGGTISWATSINDTGLIVGTSYLSGNAVRRAVKWNGPTATDLGAVGDGESWASDVNGLGQIVGASLTGGRQIATFWDGVTAIDLNGFLDEATADNWVLTSANSINDHGAITGNAYNKITGQTLGYVLSPVPEPGSLTLMFAGIMMLSAFLRHLRARPSGQNVH